MSRVLTGFIIGIIQMVKAGDCRARRAVASMSMYLPSGSLWFVGLPEVALRGVHCRKLAD